MDASLDTNVIIHLYRAGFQDILFNRFDKLIVYAFIRTQELHTHAGDHILELFDQDVEDRKIEIITNEDLRGIGMFNIFQSYVKDLRILYEGSDLGEVYAIAVAKTLGCISLVTDDIKEYGPHYTLMRIQDSEVMPFAFYELLFLDYLEGRINKQELLEYFTQINDSSDLDWNCSSKLKAFIRRFWKNPYNNTDKEWMQNFCQEHLIHNVMMKLRELSTFIDK